MFLVLEIFCSSDFRSQCSYVLVAWLMLLLSRYLISICSGEYFGWIGRNLMQMLY